MLMVMTKFAGHEGDAFYREREREYLLVCLHYFMFPFEKLLIINY